MTAPNHSVLGQLGPDAARVVAECGAPKLDDLTYFKVGLADIAGKHVRAASISYVGEVGFEIVCKAKVAVLIFDAMTKREALPAGWCTHTVMPIARVRCHKNPKPSMLRQQ